MLSLAGTSYRDQVNLPATITVFACGQKRRDESGNVVFICRNPECASIIFCLTFAYIGQDVLLPDVMNDSCYPFYVG